MIYFGIDKKRVIRVAFEAKNMVEAKKMYPEYRVYIFDINRYVITTQNLSDKGQWLFPRIVSVMPNGNICFHSVLNKFHNHSYQKLDVSDINSWEQFDIGAFNYGNRNNPHLGYIIDKDSQYILTRDYGRMIFQKKDINKLSPGVTAGALMKKGISWKDFWNEFQTSVNSKGMPVYGTKVEILD